MALSTKSNETVKMLRMPPHDKVTRWIEYFYEGYVDVIRGEALVPVERPEWIERLLNTGYVISLDEPQLQNLPEQVQAHNQVVIESTLPHMASNDQDFVDKVYGQYGTDAEVDDSGPEVEPEVDAGDEPEDIVDDGLVDEDA